MLDSCITKVLSLTREKYPNKLTKEIQYGTSGFRDRAELLPHVMFRMGLLAVLRSKLKKGATIGVMITASHNPENDNGVKLCDPTGELLSFDWEKFATELANSKDHELVSYLQKIITDCDILWDINASVFIGRDTRSSSFSLSESVCDAVNAFDGVVTNLNLVTTPQLHYIVFCKNFSELNDASTEGYYKNFSSAFLSLYSGENGNYSNELFVDAANGIGAHALKELVPYLNGQLKFTIFNDGNGVLNYKCGADYIKIQQTIPTGYDILPGTRCASFDGDADRLIYFYLDDDKKFHMLDGDKIAVLVTEFLKRLVSACNVKVEMCVIQTAYTNGNATYYIEKDLGVPTVCVPTGVKHLHHEAMKHEVGIYFESNGHGTVIFQDKVKTEIKKLSTDQSIPEQQRKACLKFLAVINLINETVGDAISDLLLVEMILHDLGWSVSDWDSIYSDIPYRQIKVKVPYKDIIKTYDACRKVKAPEGLQERVDCLVSECQRARAFIRPSGTEDIVRVYAEADTQDNADWLAGEVAAVLQQFTHS